MCIKKKVLFYSGVKSVAETIVGSPCLGAWVLGVNVANILQADITKCDLR